MKQTREEKIHDGRRLFDEQEKALQLAAARHMGSLVLRTGMVFFIESKRASASHLHWQRDGVLNRDYPCLETLGRDMPKDDDQFQYRAVKRHSSDYVV